MSKPFFLAQALSISLVLSLVSHKRERSWAHCVLLPSPNNLASSPAKSHHVRKLLLAGDRMIGKVHLLPCWPCALTKWISICASNVLCGRCRECICVGPLLLISDE